MLNLTHLINHLTIQISDRKLNYLERGSRSDISHAVHQCAKSCSGPKGIWGHHKMDNNYVWQEIRIQSSNQITTKDLEVYVDVDFAGNFDKDYTQNGDRARSRHGYITMHKGCPMSWKSYLQTEMYLYPQNLSILDYPLHQECKCPLCNYWRKS